MIGRAAALLALAALLAATSARGEDDIAEAKARFRKGAELYRAGKWRDAIAEFEAAYRLKPAGAIHFNVAQCRERLAEWPGALRSYHDYLHEVPDANDRAAVRASMQKLEQKLAAAGVQELVVYSDPPGAEVRIDGRPRGTTPFHIVLPPGTYAVALALEGHEPVTQDVALASNASRTVESVLRPKPPARVAAPVPPGPAPDLKVAPPKASAVGTQVPAEKPATKRRVYTWIAAGTAVAAIAAGAYFGIQARRDERAVQNSTALPSDATNEQRQAHQAELDKNRRDAQSNARTANILYAVGAGAAAATVPLFFWETKF